MSKIAQYLNEHILGEITGSRAVRQRFSRDGSVLSITPELVMFPRVTNDIRKAARFSWQLAEKGHVLPITVRGSGSSTTGAAIGKGLIINTTSHLDSIIHLGVKDKERFVHVQPGVLIKTLRDTLNWHGLHVPASPDRTQSTIGGAVANNSGGQYSGYAGLMGDWVTRLEVVLANGDLIETTRINKREFSKKIGLQTFEGEIYRKIDSLIEDNQELINQSLQHSDRDNTGYARLAQVKRRDGSFDLTPLFIGSQGTLGVISEIVLKTDYFSKDRTIVVAVLSSNELARDVADTLRGLEPASLEIIDGSLFATALERGKKFAFFDPTDNESTIGAVVYIEFNDFSDSVRARKLKRTLKTLDKHSAVVVSTKNRTREELTAIREVVSVLTVSEPDGSSLPPLLDGAFIPQGRQEDFQLAIAELATKYHIALPLHIRVLDGIVNVRPRLHLDKVGDKQKVFKLIAEYAQLTMKHGGMFVADSSEGRLKANVAYSVLEEGVQDLYTQVRTVFDPFGTLNPGVKQSSDIKDLVHALRPSYDVSDIIS